MVDDDTLTALQCSNMLFTSLCLVGFIAKINQRDQYSNNNRYNVPVKGATLDLTPPTPRPMRTNAAISPPKPTPASRAGGIDVNKSNVTPARYILKISISYNSYGNNLVATYQQDTTRVR